MWYTELELKVLMYGAVGLAARRGEPPDSETGAWILPQIVPSLPQRNRLEADERGKRIIQA